MTANLDESRMRGQSSPRPVVDGWTAAQSEAAWFIGKCFAVGAVLGIVKEVASPMMGKRHD